jgi:hypothetical protein
MLPLMVLNFPDKLTGVKYFFQDKAISPAYGLFTLSIMLA